MYTCFVTHIRTYSHILYTRGGKGMTRVGGMSLYTINCFRILLYMYYYFGIFS